MRLKRKLKNTRLLRALTQHTLPGCIYLPFAVYWLLYISLGFQELVRQIIPPHGNTNKVWPAKRECLGLFKNWPSPHHLQTHCSLLDLPVWLWIWILLQAGCNILLLPSFINELNKIFNTCSFYVRTRIIIIPFWRNYPLTVYNNCSLWDHLPQNNMLGKKP